MVGAFHGTDNDGETFPLLPPLLTVMDVDLTNVL